VGLAAGGIGQEMYSGIMAVALLSMFLTPLVSGLTAPIYGLIRRHRAREPLQVINLEREDLRDHVVIAGAGRMGKAVARVLGRSQLPFVVIELDQHRLEFCRDAGVATIYGDATHPLVLEAAGLEKARLLLVTTPDPVTTLAVVRHSRRLRPDLHVVARAESDQMLEELRDLAVHEVVQPQVEAGLEITRQALVHLDVSPKEIEHFLADARQDFHLPLKRGDGRAP